MGPQLYRQLQDEALGYLWEDPRRSTLFGIPIEIDPEVTGWTIWTR
jgi:hypothetical protein